jgi:hypothetical protein
VPRGGSEDEEGAALLYWGVTAVNAAEHDSLPIPLSQNFLKIVREFFADDALVGCEQHSVTR